MPTRAAIAARLRHDACVPNSNSMRDLIDKAPVIAFVKDLQGRYVYVNEAWIRFVGVSLEQAVGKSDHELFDPSFADAFVINDRSAALGETVSTEEKGPREDDLFVGHSTKFPIKDSAGNVRAVGGIVIDITDRYLAQKALEASERRYRDLLEHSPEAFFVLDVRTQCFVDTSENTERLFRLPREELLRRSPATLSPPTQPNGQPSMEAAREQIDAALRGETPVFDWIHQTGDGELLPCRIWLARVELESGPGVRASILDMREIERMRSTLESMRAQLDAVQDAMPQAVVVVEPETGIMAHCNRTYQELAPRRPLWETAEKACHHAVATGTGREEVTVTAADGTSRIMVVEVSVFQKGENGQPTRLLLVGSDVTEQRELDARLTRSRQLESLGRLAGGVAHDFNNLLTVILDSAELLAPSLEGDHQAKEDLVALKEAAGQAQQITSQLLTFARPHGGHAEIVRIDTYLSDSRRVLERLMGEGIETNFQLEASHGHVMIDRGQLQQILVNLASNSRDAMTSGGKFQIRSRTVEIEGSSKGLKPGHYVELSFCDSGTGMSSEVRERAFEPFFTTKPVGEGTGLGLSTVHGITQGAGGSTALETSPLGGTTVKVWLPLHKKHSVAAEPNRADPPAQALEILLVEDDHAVRNVNARALSQAGHTVAAAASAHEALALIESGRHFDVVVTDVAMPEISGFELAEKLHALGFYLPIIFVSGYAEDALRQRSLKASDINLLTKPFSPAALLKRVYQATARSSSTSRSPERALR